MANSKVTIKELFNKSKKTFIMELSRFQWIKLNNKDLYNKTVSERFVLLAEESSWEHAIKLSKKDLTRLYKDNIDLQIYINQNIESDEDEGPYEFLRAGIYFFIADKLNNISEEDLLKSTKKKVKKRASK